jgi:protein-disulfide isomerase
MQNNNQNAVVSAIVIAGVLIAGAILLRGNKPSAPTNAPANNGNGIPITILAPVGPGDRIIGNPQAKVALVMYEDFQCVFCGAVSGSLSNTPAIQYLLKNDPHWTAFMPVVMNYEKKGNIQFVYRDYPFLGQESIRAAEAARCAEDQSQFWQYHDYLFAHQGEENKGTFSDSNLKSFAKDLNLNTADFNNCLDSNKYAQAVADSKNEGDKAGVTGTPKGFILINNNEIASTIDGAESAPTVQQKLDNALK